MHMTKPGTNRFLSSSLRVGPALQRSVGAE
jgi:hypothetical protein